MWNLLQCLQRVKQKCGGTDTVWDGLSARLIQSTEGAELWQRRHLTVSGSWPVAISLTVEAGAGGRGSLAYRTKLQIWNLLSHALPISLSCMILGTSGSFRAVLFSWWTHGFMMFLLRILEEQSWLSILCLPPMLSILPTSTRLVLTTLWRMFYALHLTNEETCPSSYLVHSGDGIWVQVCFLPKIRCLKLCILALSSHQNLMFLNLFYNRWSMMQM